MASDTGVTWLLIDIGGVLEVVDDAHWPGEWAGRWATRLGIPREEFSRRLDDPDLPDLTVVSGAEAVYWRMLGEALGASAEQTAAMRADFWDAYCGVRNTELMDALSRLRGRIGLAVLSNSADGAREEEERRYGFSRLFDPICYSHEMGVMKPDPAVFAIALDAMGAPSTGEVLFVDDAPANVAAARALGLRAHRHVDNAGTLRAIRDAIPLADRGLLS